MNPLEQTELLSFDEDGMATPTSFLQNLSELCPPSPIDYDPKANVSLKHASVCQILDMMDIRSTQNSYTSSSSMDSVDGTAQNIRIIPTVRR